MTPLVAAPGVTHPSDATARGIDSVILSLSTILISYIKLVKVKTKPSNFYVPATVKTVPEAFCFPAVLATCVRDHVLKVC